MSEAKPKTVLRSQYRVPDYLIDEVDLAFDLAEVWGQIEAHDELERQTIALARELMEQTTEPVHRILLNYLLTDEEKHDGILGELDDFKKHMSKLS